MRKIVLLLILIITACSAHEYNDYKISSKNSSLYFKDKLKDQFVISVFGKSNEVAERVISEELSKSKACSNGFVIEEKKNAFIACSSSFVASDNCYAIEYFGKCK